MEIRALGGHESPWAKYYEVIRAFKKLNMPLHVVDGEGILVRPNMEMRLLAKFIGIDETELEFGAIHENTGGKGDAVPCLVKPIPYCLSDSKGTTRQVSAYDFHADLLAEWTETFAPSIMKSLKYFGLDMDYVKNGRFCIAEDERFDWAKRFVCHQQLVKLMKEQEKELVKETGYYLLSKIKII